MRACKTNESSILERNPMDADLQPDEESMSLSGSSLSDCSDAITVTSERNKLRFKALRDRTGPNLDSIARSENRAVWLMRMVIAIAMLISTIGVAVFVYKYVDKQQDDNFVSLFTDDAMKVAESLSNSLYAELSAIDSFVTMIVSTAGSTNQSWPQVTLPDHAVQSAKLLSSSKAILVSQYTTVQFEERDAWEEYSIEKKGWVDEAIGVMKQDSQYYGKIVEDEYNVTSEIHYSNGRAIPRDAPGPFFPQWQSYPTSPVFPPFNLDAHERMRLNSTLGYIVGNKMALIGAVANLAVQSTDDSLASSLAPPDTDFLQDYIKPQQLARDPIGNIYYPMLTNAAEVLSSGGMTVVNDEAQVVAILVVTFFWSTLIQKVLPPGAHAVVAVFENTCGQLFSYEVVGRTTSYLGPSDFHDVKYDDMVQVTEFKELVNGHEEGYRGVPLSNLGCSYTVKVYPSAKVEDFIKTNDPSIFAVSASMVFLFAAGLFLVYDTFVERRQRVVMKSAMKTSALVSSLFPENVRDRLLPDGAQRDSSELAAANTPIADLFPACSVMISDISGFTAWSSVRQPAQVFLLLESIYGAFDELAKKRGVYKVETIGDSYVAVVGLPAPRKDHAAVIAKFAGDCRTKINRIAKNLEVTLGPDTGELRMRFGLNSGAVTAGVLRGEKSRFQLFGDTVNMAARMESTGLRNTIQASQSTYDELVASGKGHWCRQRPGLVDIKGKGAVTTYFVNPNIKATGTASLGSGHSETAHDEREMGKTARLIDWTVDILKNSIRSIIAHREAASLAAMAVARTGSSRMSVSSSFSACSQSSGDLLDLDSMISEQVTEVIELPEYSGVAYNFESVELADDVESQLREFVTRVASYYGDNPFHNFEHASHVTMSVVKLLSRIVAAPPTPSRRGSKNNNNNNNNNNNKPSNDSSGGDDHTYGITNDPLTHFACVLSALIHDVDHPGVPNAQLVKEDSVLAEMYKGKSVAEQNSVDIAWSMFMDTSFDRLRQHIAPTRDEIRRLRQLVINCVMATDIMDKDLIKARNDRWYKAFSMDVVDRKATIVIEHLIQASDVAHTMQHWHVYQKWNERLYREQLAAFHSGRADKDPTDGWYQGELNFLDFYVIPLAQKLAECGVFGVSSHEYLGYATKNREEWELKGAVIVAKMKESAQRGHHLG